MYTPVGRIPLGSEPVPLERNGVHDNAAGNVRFVEERYPACYRPSRKGGVPATFRHTNSTLSISELKKSADQISTDRRSITKGNTSSRACSTSNLSTASRSIVRNTSAPSEASEV